MSRRAVSVLDLSPVMSGKTPSDALAATLDLASLADSLGYRRYWLAEHHNAKGLACSAPEVIASAIAARTSRIRVGSGGVMLPNHSPLKIAEVFRTLSGLFPGRIDLGVGRAPGSDARTARALRRIPPGEKLAPLEAMEEDLTALLAYLDEDLAPRAPFATSIVAIPSPVIAPSVHVLGTSEFGAILAAKRGLPFAFAHHFVPSAAVTVVNQYRAAFVPSRELKEPYVILAVAALAADTDEEAARLVESARLGALHFAEGRRDNGFPSLEEAAAHTWTEEDVRLAEGFGRATFGSAKSVNATLAALREETGADEIMITTTVHDHAARRRSYELLAP